MPPDVEKWNNLRNAKRNRFYHLQFYALLRKAEWTFSQFSASIENDIALYNMQDNRTDAIWEDPCLSMAGTNNTTHRVSATYASLPASWEFPIANPSLIIHVANATLCLNCGSSHINDIFRWRSRNRAMRQNLSETQCKCNLKTRRLQYIEPRNWAACVSLFATISTHSDS